MKKEYQSLLEVALMNGLDESEITSSAQQKVLAQYFIRFPDGDKSAEVEYSNGKFNVVSDGKNITPKEFEPIAEKYAFQELLRLMKKNPLSQATKEPAKSQEKVFDATVHAGSVIIKVLFWGYNGFYVIYLVLAILTLVLNFNQRDGLIEFFKNLGAYKTFLTIFTASVPVFAVLAARKNKENISRILFTFEIPFILVGMLLLSIFNNPSPGVFFLTVVSLSATPIIFLKLSGKEYEDFRSNAILYFFTQWLVIAFAYLSLIFAFFLPAALASVFSVFRFNYIRNPIDLLISLSIGALGVLTISAVLALPFVALYLSTKSFVEQRKFMAQKFGEKMLANLTSASLIIFFLLFFASNYQQGHQYITTLANLNVSEDFEERKEVAKDLVGKKEEVDKAFKDLSNVRSKYIFVRGDDMIANIYEGIGLPKSFASLIQTTFDVVAYPFVYQGSLKDRSVALQNYALVFGESYNSSTRTPAAPINRVQLVKRNIKVESSPDYRNLLATVTVEEEFENTTSTQQEVIYEFYFDSNVVMTDLKLGPNLEFDGIIAPKGAAQRTYEQELTRRRDPALLEQIGPRQYRLRIFPIPGNRDRTTLGGKNQRVQFTYVTELIPDGYALPKYLNARNIKDNSRITVTYDGNKTNTKIGENLATSSANLCNVSRLGTKSDLGDVTGYIKPLSQIPSVSSKGYVCNPSSSSLSLNLVSGKKIGFYIDVSYPNNENSQVEKLSNILKNNSEFLNNNDVELIQFNDILSSPVKLSTDNYESELDEIIFFGKKDILGIINELGISYDFVFVLTNNKDILLNSNKKDLSISVATQFYMVHDGKIPVYPSDLFAEIIQNNGQSFSEVSAALRYAAITSALGTPLLHNTYWSHELSYTEVQNSYDFTSIDTDPADPLSYVISQAYLYSKYANVSGIIKNQIQFLDNANKFAQNSNIVTPHSSLIALVNEQQLANLDRNARGTDRYDDSALVTDTSLRDVAAAPRLPNAISIGRISSPALKTNSFGGGGGSFGALSLPGRSSGMMMLEGGGGGYGVASGFGGLTGLFIVANGLLFLIGGGYFVVISLKKKFRK